MASTILQTRNADWSFFGSIGRIGIDSAADPASAWEIASGAIASATDASSEGVRDFLDSRHGRHFADDVANELWRASHLRPRSTPSSPAGRLDDRPRE